MKVGIVGAGLSGLVCAYELLKQGVNDIVFFESMPYAGGKMRYNIGNINKTSIYKYTNELIDELGLSALYMTQRKDQMGMLKGRKLIKLENAARSMQIFAPKKVKLYNKQLLAYLHSLDFDLFEPSEEVKRLRTMSFAEFVQSAPKMLQLYAFSGPLNFLFEDDLTKVAADLGMYTLTHGFETASGNAYVFEENLMPMALVLEDIILKQGVNIRFNATVERVTPQSGKFEVHYLKRDVPHTDTVDAVVLTTPLPITQNVMPDLQIASDVIYKPLVIYLVQGELRYPERQQLIGMKTKDKGNIRIFSTASEYEHILVPYDPEQEVNFEILYKPNKYRVMKKQRLNLGWPVRGPNARVPELATNVEGAYICGDFYYYSLMEVPIRTAQKVAQMIIARQGRGKS